MTLGNMRTAKAGNSNFFSHNARAALMLGGRFTKCKGTVSSIAPMVAGGMAPVMLSGRSLATGAGSAWALDGCGADPAGATVLNRTAVAYSAGKSPKFGRPSAKN